MNHHEPDANSPLLVIKEDIEVAAFDVAPERAEELGRLTQGLGIHVFVDEDQGQFYFAVDIDTGRISVGLAALERLWAYSMAYGHVIRLSQEVAALGGGRVLLASTPEGLDAMRLLSWARLGEDKQERLPWPTNLPKPELSPLRHSLSELANGLFRKTLGWILLHEVGHVVHRHQQSHGRPLPELVEEEREADRWAFDWILHDGDARRSSDPKDFVLRTLGVTCALSVIATFEVYQRTFGVTHPDPPDRLWKFLELYVPYEVAGPVSPAFAWFCAVSIVKLHLDHGNVCVDPSATYSDSRACLADLLLALKRHRT